MALENERSQGPRLENRASGKGPEGFHTKPYNHFANLLSALEKPECGSAPAAVYSKSNILTARWFYNTILGAAPLFLALEHGGSG